MMRLISQRHSVKLGDDEMIKLTKHYNADLDEVDDEDDRAVKDRGRVEIFPLISV
jgi:hypothetical protein